MNIRGGHTIEVFRNATVKDRHGDPADGQPERIGTIDHCVLQWATAQGEWLKAHPAGTFQETSSLLPVIFAPRDAAIQLRERDRVKLNGDTYRIIGDRVWDEDHPMTGSNFGYYMIQAQKVS